MGKEKIILTGDRPTGRLHIGHYVGSLKRRVDLQNAGDYSKMFIFIADSQALTDNIDNPEKVRQNVIEVALDYLACGIDPTKATIFIQSQIPELCELSFYYMDLVSVSRLQRNPTVKSEIQMRNFEASIPVGFFTYPISQAADITAFRATTVPVGEDQEPMLEQAREIVRRFNYIYGETLVEPEILLPDNAACLRLPGTDGKAKMSKSLGNVIAPSEINDKYGAEILRLWVASSDYTGEISLGEKILKGTVDAYRRFRNTIRFLLANTSDFDIKKDAVPVAEMVELDRWAIARMKALQEEILDKYDQYQFHTAYAALQLFASGDLGGFYLDILKDRLYTTAPDSAARRSAQTALWYITDALLKLLAPALSFTAEEAYAVFNPENKGTIFVERYAELPNVKEGVELLNKWSIIRDLRSNVQMEIERQREKGLIGSSLQAEVSLKLPQEEYDLIKGLGDEAAFVMITSKVTLDGVSPERVITVKPSEAKKCERCWQYKESVGEDKNYPTLCCRCVGNLFGTPETRRFA